MQRRPGWRIFLYGGWPFAIPLVAGVLAPAGIVLDPAVGALVMSASTIIVAFNARRLRLPD